MLGDKVPGVIDRTTRAASSDDPERASCRSLLRPLRRAGSRLLPQLVDDDGDIEIGPIPEGTPVDLLANLQPLPETDGSGAGQLRMRRSWSSCS